MKLIDLTGKKFNRLEVIERAENIGKKVAWKCRCDCGNEIVATGSALKSGNTQSCGCLHKENHSKHGMYKTRIYKTWGNMNARCYCKNSLRFDSYGGRGITVCDEWKNSFEAFYDWAMANGYADDLTIDRIDVNGNYEPENCRWVSNLEQQNNRRNNVLIEYGCESHTIAEWERILGIKKGNLHHMLKVKAFEEIVRGRTA